ncbi:hypothetical protein JYU34_017212, partial [Plutella xylostella]
MKPTKVYVNKPFNNFRIQNEVTLKASLRPDGICMSKLTAIIVVRIYCVVALRCDLAETTTAD